MTMMRGVGSLAQQRARQQRGGLATLARVGGEAMTAPARAGFRARFERQARELAAAQGRSLSPKQLEESANALLRAHMAKMAEARLMKADQRRAERAERVPRQPTAHRRSDVVPVAPAVVVRPVRMCVGCWMELWPDSPFPREASSILCARHLDAYVSAAAAAQP